MQKKLYYHVNFHTLGGFSILKASLTNPVSSLLSCLCLDDKVTARQLPGNPAASAR